MLTYLRLGMLHFLCTLAASRITESIQRLVDKMLYALQREVRLGEVVDDHVKSKVI